MKRSLIAVLLSVLSIGTKAEEADSLHCADTVATSPAPVPEKDFWGVSVAGNVSYLIHAGEFNKAILHSYGTSHYDVRVRWQPGKRRETAYDRAWNHPALQFGLLYTDFSQVKIYRDDPAKRSRIGYLLTLYGGLQFEILHKGRWTLGADLLHGAAYCPHPFNETTNRDNEVIGTTLSIFVSGGLFAKYRISPHWSASLGVDFKHFSNGTLDRPNLGANTIGPTLAVHYDLGEKELGSEGVKELGSDGVKEDFDKKIYVDAVVGLGMKALSEHFNVYQSKHNPIYGFFTTMVAPMYRYHLLHASGIGIDYTYADYVYRIRDFDQMRGLTDHRYSPHILGVSLRHEFFYRHFSVNVGVGTYLLNRTGHTAETDESRIYQNVGLRYSFPFTRDRLFLGYNVKAHRFQKVNCVQILLGYRI